MDYKKFQKFKDFVNEKGYPQLIDEHIQAGHPEEYFIESYRRYAKSLIAIDGVKGKDKKTGLLFEFVLNENPYDLESNFISANLFYKKRPIADQLVTIFSRKNKGDLKIEHFETDKKGYVEFIVEEGREYLLDSRHCLFSRTTHGFRLRCFQNPPRHLTTRQHRPKQPSWQLRSSRRCK